VLPIAGNLTTDRAMAEATEYMFKHAEVVTALIKAQGLHQGRWALAARFGFAATNIGLEENKEEVNPAGVMPLLSLGLRRVTDENEKSNLVVDAASVNPA
jgi:hypothetical protein